MVAVAYTAGGKRVNWADRALAYTLALAQYKAALKAGLTRRMELDLPADAQTLRLVLVVRDLATERLGAVEVPVQAGK